MGKKKGNIKVLLLFLFALFTVCSYSQEHFTSVLKWKLNDSSAAFIYQDISQIIEWGKSNGNLVTVNSEKFRINNREVLILLVDKCSGIYCLSIYIFVAKNKHWQLIASSNARIKEKIETIIDNKSKKIIFNTKYAQIGELTFKTLNLE